MNYLSLIFRHNRRENKMKALYEVTAVKTRRIKGINGYFTADDGVVVHKSYQVASSKEEAVRLVKAYHLPSCAKYSSIRAEYLRPY